MKLSEFPTKSIGIGNVSVTFSTANISLPRTKWFRQIIDKMYWRVEGLAPAYREDCMEAYYDSRKRFNYSWQ